MESIIKLNIEDRKDIFQEAAYIKGISPAIMEKDFWVCWVLRNIFADEYLSKIMLFKGGTSLSKVFKVIERFSEDIDLILDWRLLTESDPLSPISGTKQAKMNKIIDESASAFIPGELKEKISAVLTPACSVDEDKKDPHILQVTYPESFSDQYIIPRVKLEIGPLASWVPNDKYIIIPYLHDVFPELIKDYKCELRSIKAERTFWEKVTILHHEAHRPKDSSVPTRYSRHYYDLFMLSRSAIKDSALKDIKLLESVVAFKKRFYPRGWARYDLAVPGTMRLVPTDHVLKFMKNDYRNMESMIFGEYPSFKDIVSGLSKLESEINSV